jgi:hypothetical protein
MKPLDQTTFQKEFGAWITERRQRLGLTPRDLSVKVGVTPFVLASWENGDRSITAFHYLLIKQAIKERMEKRKCHIHN